MSHPVLFDTDPGIDDAMALLFAHYSPDVDLVGITTTFGNAAIEQTTRNAQLLNGMFGLGCEVHMGAGSPLVLAPDEPPAFVHGEDGLGDAGLEAPPLAPDGDAVRFIVDTLKRRPGEITIVAVGRMTNLAEALAQAPEITGLVKRVVIMGGALGLHGFSGNITPTAEANIYGDPHAASRVLAAPWPVTMVGLDVTMRTVMSDAHIAELAERGGETGRFLQRISAHYRRFYGTRGFAGFPIHDASALAYVLAPELFGVAEGGLAVATNGPTLGQTVLAPEGKPPPGVHGTPLPVQEACVDVKGDEVVQLYLDTLLNA